MNFGHSANNTNRDLGMLHCLLSETSYRINSTLSINKYTSDNSCLRSINRGGFSLKKVSRVLLQKSQEAFLLALEIYNKPTITYRIEGFSFFIINAWELLLKARLIETSGNEKVIYYKKSRGQERRSLSIEDCLKRVFPEDNPVKKNLDSITKIRNAATHFLVEELEVIYTGLFQSAVLNYVTYLAQWFSLSITDRCSPAMLSLFTDVKDIDSVKLKKKYDPYILEFIQSEQERLTKTRTTENSIEYSIPIDYKLALVKSPGKADIVLSKGLDGDKMGIIIEVPKDVNETHPLIQKGVVEEVKKRLPSVPFNN